MFRTESIQRQVFIYNKNIGYGVIIYQHMYDMSYNDCQHKLCFEWQFIPFLSPAFFRGTRSKVRFGFCTDYHYSVLLSLRTFTPIV
jgi:hypothetical protein